MAQPPGLQPLPAENTKPPLVELLALALPTIAQMASYTVMQFGDTWMLSRVGDVQATAAGQGSMLTFAFISFGMGVLFCVNTLVSQAFGKGDNGACGRFLWQGVWFGLIYGAAMLPLLPLARPLFDLMGHDPALASPEALYVRVTLGGAAFKLVATAVGQFLLAVNRPNVVLLAAFTAMVLDTILNYVLIFGKFGFPAMGVAGAAWTTNFSALVELAVMALFVARTPLGRLYHAFDWKLRPQLMRTLMNVGVPSGVQIVTEVFAWTLFSVLVVGRLGNEMMAATNYVFRFMSVSFMPAFGLATAVTALVGRYIGMGRPDIAARRAHLGFAVTAVYMVLCGLLFYFGRGLLMTLFTRQPTVLSIGTVLLTYAAVYQLFDAMYILYNGALRGAGDTFVPAVVTGTLCWTITVGGGYLAATYLPQFGINGPWLAATVYAVVLGVYLMLRFTRGGWRSIKLDTDEGITEASNVPEPSARLPDLQLTVEK